jgi:putative ABC transport system permease protein
VETSLIFRLSLRFLRAIARIVPGRDRSAWLLEWESELRARRARLADRHALGQKQEIVMLRDVLGSFHDAAWLRRQFTRDSDFIHDLRYGVRLLRRSPGFALLTVAVLAIGIGATSGIFSVVDALLVRELPYQDANRVVLLFEADASNRAAVDAVAPGNFIDWRDQARSLEAIAAAEPFGFTLTGMDEPQAFPGARVTAGFFDAFGVPALYGRTFTPDEYEPGRSSVVVLSYGTWMRMGGDPGIVGTVLRLNGQPRTVVGVMPSTFAPRLLVTAMSERGVSAPKMIAEFEREIRAGRYFNVVAKLKPGITMAQAQAELDGIAGRLAQQHPRTNATQVVQIVSLRDHLAGSLRRSMGLLFAAVALLLVIAMANCANLLLTRAAVRVREIAVRGAIGADRGRLVRQMLAETLLVAGLGCAAGLLIAYGTGRLIATLGPADIPALSEITLNGRVLLFCCLLTCLVAFAVGVVPAWRGANIPLADVATRLSAGDGRVAPRRARGRFVVAQLGFALMLLAAGGLLLRSFSTLLDVAPGFTADGVAALQVFARGGNRTPAQQTALVQQIIEGMRAVPQVREAGAVSVLPFLDTSGAIMTAVVIEGRAAPARGDEPGAALTIATPGYFPAMRIPLLEGRAFTDHDAVDRLPVAIVSRTFARTHWPDRSPVGQRIRFERQGQPVAVEIVGVVGDVRHVGLDRPPVQEIFVPHAQAPSTEMTFVARTEGDPARQMAALKAQVYAVVPNQAVYRTAILEDLVSSSLNDRRFMLALVLGVGILAVALAATGVYGVMSLVTAQRTREFGVRLALGAGRAEILRMVMRQGAALMLAGIGSGLAGALLAGQVLRDFLYGIGPNDPSTLAGVCGTLAAVAAIACLVPALRATRVNPLVTMRTE